MEGIRSLEIDLDKNVVKINGKEATEDVIVKLPGPERPYKYSKLIVNNFANNIDLDPGNRIVIDVDVSCYDVASDNKLL